MTATRATAPSVCAFLVQAVCRWLYIVISLTLPTRLWRELLDPYFTEETEALSSREPCSQLSHRGAGV